MPVRTPVQKPRRDRTGPLFEVNEERWPEVGGILSRQPWADVEKLLPGEAGKAIYDRQRRFVELLLQWNRSVSNLISQNDENRIVTAHLAPSVEPAEWLRSHEYANWLDFGSGGGFPALPLAICGVGTAWDLVESRRTKTLFLRRACEQLALAGVRIFAARLEDLLLELVGGEPDANPAGTARMSPTQPTQALRPPYDGFTSRATMSLGPTLRLAHSMVRPGGAAFLWKGSRLDDEIEQAGDALDGWTESERRVLVNGQTTLIKFTRNSE
jgi:16S rRNA (guanine527-N7)-methyltransferase